MPLKRPAQVAPDATALRPDRRKASPRRAEREPPLTAPAEPLILPPYTRDSARLRRRRLVWHVSLLAGFCLIYGGLIGLFAPYLMLPLLAPIAILLAVVIWALPEQAAASAGLSHDQLLPRLFFIFLVSSVMWPNYLAVALPGLPWISVARITVTPLDLTLLVAISTSKSFRAALMEVMRASPVLFILMAVFQVLQFVSIFLSASVPFSIDRYAIALTTWTGVMFVAVYIFRSEGVMTKAAYVLWMMAVLLGGLAVLEYRARHVLWAGHVPSFFRIDNALMAAYLAGGGRNYTDIYRAQATFSTSIGMGEYVALVTPFVLEFAMGRYNLVVRVLAFLTVPFLFVSAFVTGSRSGMIGYFMSLLLYLGAWSLVRWRTNRDSLIGPAISFGYPAIGAGFLALTFISGRLHQMIWGGGETQSSTDARVAQYTKGWPKILHRPWGYGIGEGGLTLDFHQPGGLLTIDSYYLVVALEYGIFGFFIYYALFFAAIYYAGRHGIDHTTRARDESFLIPILIALCNYIVIKSVYAGEDNQSLAFIILGMAAALVWRARKRAAS